MVSPLNIAISSMALCGSSRTGLENSRTHRNIFQAAISCLGLAAVGSYLGLNPSHASAALLSLKGAAAIDSTIFNISYLSRYNLSTSDKAAALARITSAISGIWGFVKHSAPLLGLSLAASITSIYLQSKNLSHFGETVAKPRIFIPLALNLSILGAVAMGSTPVFATAVAVNLAWGAYVNLAELKCLPMLV